MKETTENVGVERKVADVLLQRTRRVKLGNLEYEVAQPTIGTLVIVSECLCSVPEFNDEKGNYFFETLAKAKDCRPLAYAIAALILGSRHWDDKEPVKGGIMRLFRRKRAELRRDVIARRVLDYCRPSEIGEMITGLLAGMEVADFFATTIFLGGVHMTRPTKMGKEAIARGR